MAAEEGIEHSQEPSPITAIKRGIVSESTEILASKKRRADSLMSPPPNADAINKEGGQDTSIASSPLPPDNIIKDSSFDHSTTLEETHQQETFGITGETGSEQSSDADVDIMTSEDLPDGPKTNDAKEPIKPLHPPITTDNVGLKGSSEANNPVDPISSSPIATAGISKEVTDDEETKRPNETTKLVDPASSSSKAASDTVNEASVSPKTSETTSHSTLAIGKIHSIPASSVPQGTAMPSPGTTPSSQLKDVPPATVIDRSSAVRLPFSDKFFFTDEAYEAYSYDSFTATIDRIAKNNKPGLALSSNPPKPSDTSSIQLSTPQHEPFNTSTTKPRHDNGDSMDEDSSDHEDNIKASSVGGDNMLDSLLDSISKNDRPVKQPPPMRPLSDIEIAMQAADPSQERS